MTPRDRQPSVRIVADWVERIALGCAGLFFAIVYLFGNRALAWLIQVTAP